LDAKKIELKVYPENGDMIVTVRHEIDMKMSTRKALTSLLSAVKIFMDGNTICKLEIEEIG
jgi:hypothetical protein